MTQHHTHQSSHQSDSGTSSGPPRQVDHGAESALPVGDAVLDIIAEVEAQLQRIRSAQASSDQQLASLADRSRALAEAEKSMQEQARQVALQREALEQASRVHDEDRRKFAQQQRETQQQMERGQAEIQRMRNEIEQQHAQAAQLEHQWKDRSKEFDHARAHWEKQNHEAHAAIQKAQADLAQREKKLETAQREFDLAQQNAAAARHDADERLRRTEAELTHHHAQLDKQKAELQRHQQAWEESSRQFEMSRAAWEKQRLENESSLASKAASIDEREAKLTQDRAGLQQREQALARAQQALDAERQRMTSLESDLKREHEELTKNSRALELDNRELSSRVEHAERNVGELIQRLEKSQAAIERKTFELSGSTQKVLSLQAKLEQAGASMTETRQAVKRLQEREEELKGQFRQEGNRAKQLEAQRDEARKTIEKVTADLASTQNRAETLRVELETRVTELSDARKKLEVAGQKLAQFAQVLKEQTVQVERGAEAMATVEEQRTELAHLTEELARYKLSTDPAEIVRRDERIRELTEALREARGQSAGGDVAEKEQRIAEMASTINQLRLDLQQSEVELDTARRKLEEKREELSGVAGGAGGGESDAAAFARLAERDARIAELTTKLEQLDSDYSSQRSDAQRHVQEHQSVVARMQDRIDTLERELLEARSAPARDHDDHGPKKNDLREQARRIRDLAEHLRRRKIRLEGVHERLRDVKSASSGHGGGAAGNARDADALRREIEERARFTEQIHIDRQRLADIQATLATAEREMIRKWARPRAIWTMGWFAVLLVTLAVSSWFIADHFAPARRAASITLHAKSPTGVPLSENELNQWRDFHLAMLADPQFRSTLAKRFADRQFVPYDNLAVLGHRLDSDLTVDTHVDDKLRLTLSGYGGPELLLMLDTLGTTYMKESQRSRGQHSDGAEAVLRGEYMEGGQPRYATLNPLPLQDTRFELAAIIFSVLTALCVTLFVILSIRLGRARRAFESDLAVPAAVPDDDHDQDRVQIT